MTSKTFKRIVVILCAIVVLASSVFIFTACTEAEKVSQNISQEADNFNVSRRLVVINGRTDTIVFEMIGNFSFELTGSRIIATVETEKGVYKKHSVGLPQEAFWFVEDLEGADVSKYRYEVNFIPEMVWPFEVTMND